MDKVAEQLKRIADILETILKLVKDDMEASKKGGKMKTLENKI